MIDCYLIKTHLNTIIDTGDFQNIAILNNHPLDMIVLKMVSLCRTKQYQIQELQQFRNNNLKKKIPLFVF